MSCTAE